MLKIKDINDSIRLEILEVYLSGSSSKLSVEKKYHVSHGCIYRWLRIFGLSDKVPPEEMRKKELENSEVSFEKEITSLKLRIKQLELSLKQAEMARDGYDCMIGLAEDTYHIKVRKNSAAK